VQVLEASVTGARTGASLTLLALSSEGIGRRRPGAAAGLMTNPAGSAIVNAIGPIRQVVRGEGQKSCAAIS